MPRYDFTCKHCRTIFEKELPFGHRNLPKCPQCKGSVEKIIAPPAIHFRGAGFFNTDSKAKPKEKQAEPVKTKTPPKDGTEKKKEEKQG